MTLKLLTYGSQHELDIARKRIPELERRVADHVAITGRKNALKDSLVFQALAF